MSESMPSPEGYVYLRELDGVSVYSERDTGRLMIEGSPDGRRRRRHFPNLAALRRHLAGQRQPVAALIVRSALGSGLSVRQVMLAGYRVYKHTVTVQDEAGYSTEVTGYGHLVVLADPELQAALADLAARYQALDRERVGLLARGTPVRPDHFHPASTPDQSPPTD